MNADSPHLTLVICVCKISYFAKLVPSNSELTTGP
jgi:hypothetical protein